jgi:hypothetical protein
MKKLVILLIFELALCVFISLKVSSAALGLSPAGVNINFKPYENYTITYKVYSDKPEMNIDIYCKGILENYTTFDKKSIKGSGSFQATINLPGEIKEPGPHTFLIGAAENVSSVATEGFFATAIIIEGSVFFSVPYPGKYIDAIKFGVEDVNVGQPLNFELEVINHGWENSTVKADIEILKDNQKIDTIELGEKFLETHQKHIFRKQIDSNKYGAGIYNATALVDYGDPNRLVRVGKVFRIGTLFVEVVNWTREFYVEDINKFIVEVESNWNNPIDKVYAQVSVYDKDNLTNVLDEFKTTPESLERWLRKNLTGHLEAYHIKEPGIYKANITVFYEKSSTEKIVEITGKKKTNITFVVIGIVVFILILSAIIIFVIRRKR